MRRTSRGTARAQVYEMALDEIVALEMPPGQPISENELALRYGVSRTPVREALIQLADDGLVEIYPQAGTFVSRISVQAVREAQFVREALERAALRLAIESLSTGDLRMLDANLERQREAQAANDVDAFYTLDEAFHRAFVERSGYPGVWRIAQRAKVHLNRTRRLSLPAGSTIGALIEQHAAILRLVAERDADAADAALSEHLRMVLADLLALQQRHPDYFDEGDARGGSGAPVADAAA